MKKYLAACKGAACQVDEKLERTGMYLKRICISKGYIARTSLLMEMI
jgi:hypothetical protein